MSTIFNNKSRFSILNEDADNIVKSDKNNKRDKNTSNNKRFHIEEEKKNNNFKESENTRYTSSSSSSRSDRGDRRNRFNYNPEKEKQKMKDLENEKIKKNLDITSFPEIGAKVATGQQMMIDNIQTKQSSFLEKLNTVKENKNEEKEEEFIADGCVSISFKNRQVIYNYGKMSVKENEDFTTPHDIMYNLVRVCENRKYEYIKNWGEEDYDNTFLFKNYDYGYFDHLDELYEMEMEKRQLELDNLENNEDYL
jgi:hypothetical protein